MKTDEFAFLNRQLAGMLREGIPLEGALRRLCANLGKSPLRTELTALENDLAQGESLVNAVNRRELPELYRRLVTVAARGENLPGILTLLADYYQRAHDLWTRLRGLLVYPVIVLAVAMMVSGLFIWIYRHLVQTVAAEFGPVPGGDLPVFLWLPPVWLVLALVCLLVVFFVPAVRRRLAWAVPGFRESHVAQFAEALRMLLQTGMPLDEALELMQDLERGSPAGEDVRQWRRRLAEGEGRFAAFAAGSRAFPPMFLWLVEQGGEDLAGGLDKAAELFRQRAQHQIEMLLYAALPVTVVALGLLVAVQLGAVLRPVVLFLNLLGAVGS